MKEVVCFVALAVFAWSVLNDKWAVCALIWTALMLAATPYAMEMVNVFERIFTLAGMCFMTGTIWSAAIWQLLDKKQERNG